MTEEEKKLSRRFYKAEQEAGFVEKHTSHTAQTISPSYKLAFHDTDFLLREELRPVRFQLELLKTEMLMEEAGIGSMLVFGRWPLDHGSGQSRRGRGPCRNHRPQHRAAA
jgi:hypothetical protein